MYILDKYSPCGFLTQNEVLSMNSSVLAVAAMDRLWEPEPETLDTAGEVLLQVQKQKFVRSVIAVSFPESAE